MPWWLAGAADREVAVEKRTACPCDFCGEEIAASDFEAGRAATVMKKSYCSSCMIAAIERSKREDFVPQFLTPQPGSVHPPLDPPSKQR